MRGNRTIPFTVSIQNKFQWIFFAFSIIPNFIQSIFNSRKRLRDRHFRKIYESAYHSISNRKLHNRITSPPCFYSLSVRTDLERFERQERSQELHKGKCKTVYIYIFSLISWLFVYDQLVHKFTFVMEIFRHCITKW